MKKLKTKLKRLLAVVGYGIYKGIIVGAILGSFVLNYALVHLVVENDVRTIKLTSRVKNLRTTVDFLAFKLTKRYRMTHQQLTTGQMMLIETLQKIIVLELELLNRKEPKTKTKAPKSSGHTTMPWSKK